MADTSPVPGLLKRSDVLAQAEQHRPRKAGSVSPTFQVFVLGFVGTALFLMGAMLMLDGAFWHWW